MRHSGLVGSLLMALAVAWFGIGFFTGRLYLFTPVLFVLGALIAALGKRIHAQAPQPEDRVLRRVGLAPATASALTPFLFLLALIGARVLAMLPFIFTGRAERYTFEVLARAILPSLVSDILTLLLFIALVRKSKVVAIIVAPLLAHLLAFAVQFLELRSFSQAGLMAGIFAGTSYGILLLGGFVWLGKKSLHPLVAVALSIAAAVILASVAAEVLHFVAAHGTAQYADRVAASILATLRHAVLFSGVTTALVAAIPEEPCA